MKNNTTVQFPQTFDAFQQSVKTAIEMFQGSPVKNLNKLNEAIAAALAFKNYDQLSAALSLTEDAPEAYQVEYRSADNEMVINGYPILLDLCDEGIVNYRLSDTDDRIYCLRQWIAEAQGVEGRSSQVSMMQKDLDTLMATEDEFVLEDCNSHGFIAADLEPALFNQICDEMIAAAKAYYTKLAGTPSKTGTVYHDVVTYYGNEDVGTLYAGELVLLKDALLSEDDLPLGTPFTPFKGEVPPFYAAAYLNEQGQYVAVSLD